MFKPEVPDTGGPVVALIERKTTLAILGVGAPAVLFNYLFESLTHR